MIKSISRYSIGAILLLTVTIVIAVYDLVNISEYSGQIIDYYKWRVLIYCVLALVSCSYLIIILMKYDLKESHRKKQKEDEACEQEEFLEEFFKHNDKYFETKTEIGIIRRETVIGILRVFTEGSRNTIIFLIREMDRYKKENMKLEKELEELKQKTSSPKRE